MTTEITGLMEALESALSDVVQALEKMNAPARHKGIETILSGVESALSDLASNSEQRLDLSPLVAAIKGLTIAAPSVTVEAVMPEPVVHIHPADNKGATWDVSIPAGGGYPARTMTIKRTA